MRFALKGPGSTLFVRQSQLGKNLMGERFFHGLNLFYVLGLHEWESPYVDGEVQLPLFHGKRGRDFWRRAASSPMPADGNLRDPSATYRHLGTGKSLRQSSTEIFDPRGLGRDV
jgi:hypothetical protein